MNKKILISVFIIGLLVLGLGWGTYSYFSDVETSKDNVFTAGTIDISVTGDGYTWETGATLADMKPCEKDYIKFVIHNDGTNPVNVWKHILNVVCNQGTQTEPEIEEEGETPKFDIDTVIWYDLKVFVPIEGHPEGGWWQTIYDQDVTISEITCEEIFLGMIPVGGTMEVTQSYHMDEEVTNWAQGDTMTFDIEIIAEQLKGSVQLENKKQAGPTGETGEWIVQDKGDGIYGDLTYNMKGPTFDYTFEGTAPLGGTEYCLIYYADPWEGDNPGALIGYGKTDASGYITLSGSIDLGMDLPASGDANYPAGAKIWLVTSSDYNGGAKSTGPMTGWNPGNYLFETGLITYDDTDA